MSVICEIYNVDQYLWVIALSQHCSAAAYLQNDKFVCENPLDFHKRGAPRPGKTRAQKILIRPCYLSLFC